MKFAVLIASHNRRDTTLGCLSRLLPQLGEGDGVYLRHRRSGCAGSLVIVGGGADLLSVNVKGCKEVLSRVTESYLKLYLVRLIVGKGGHIVGSGASA